MFMTSVLPPISTAGLSSEDVTELSIRVREQMIATLREISSSPPPSSSGSPASQPKPPIILATAPSPSDEKVEEITKLRSDTATEPDSRPSTAQSMAWEVPPSPARSRASMSENGADTEEDDGLVLVGRPT